MKKVLILLLLLLVAAGAEARIGGGDSYSDDSSSSSDSSDYSSDSSDSDYGSSDYGSSSGGSSGGGGSADAASVMIVGIFMLFVFVGGVANGLNQRSVSLSITPSASPVRGPTSMSALGQHDPNFSEIVFTDFCYSLFARFHEARGRGRVDDLAPYFAADVRAAAQANGNVDGVVVGSSTVVAFRGIDTPAVEAEVEFEANYTEGSERWYVKEVWTLTRARDVLSPRPENAKAEHCPKCGAALQTRTDGACLHCGTVVKDGTFHWFVTAINVAKKVAKPPQLGSGQPGPERGLDKPTVIQPWFARNWKAFGEKRPDFSRAAFEERVAYVARELQDAWTARDWSRARPLETDALFQNHRYWIDEYLRQGLRNVVGEFRIDNIEIAKVTSDAFYDAITVRLYASGCDYTQEEKTGKVVSGFTTQRRQWSEYWTFIRGRAASPGGSRICPNCGASLAEGQTAICAYCGGKITTGEFPWVLSRIEQDESYRG